MTDPLNPGTAYGNKLEKILSCLIRKQPEIFLQLLKFPVQKITGCIASFKAIYNPY
jgi:hypothetical protein